MHLSIVVPTYKEKENLEELIPAIDKALSVDKVSYDILIVDDNSMDGSEELINSMTQYPVKIMVRKNVRGLSSAVFDGLLAVKGDIIGFMDADLSHPPSALPGVFKWIASGEAELVIGSRLVKGGGMGAWPWYRRLTSWGARMLARPLTPVKDITSGFFFFKKDVLPKENLNLDGFKIGLEIVVKGHYKKVKEYPIVFHDRQHGESKLSGKVMTEYLKQLAQLYRAKFLKNSLKSIADKLWNRVLEWGLSKKGNH